MKEDRIQQVLEIEKQAKEIQEQAKREAQEIPAKAEQEAQAIIMKARADAQEEARKMVESAQSNDASDQTVEDVSGNSEFEAAARKNLDKAVAFVVERVIGKAA